MADDKRKKQREELGRPPGIPGKVGRGVGHFLRVLGEGEAARQQAERMKTEAMRQSASAAGSAISDAGRRFVEGVGSAASDRPYNPARVAPDAGKEQSADEQGMGPPAPEGFTTAPATPAGRMGPPTMLDQQVRDSQQNPTISAPTPPPPPQTLTTSAGNTFPTRDNSVFEEQAENIPTFDVGGDPRRGRGSDIPDGFTQIIRGTDVTFQGPEAGGREFRALPGMSLEDSQKAAAAESPGFQFLQKQDVERQRANAETLRAEASQTQARYANAQSGINPTTGLPTLMVPRGDGSGYDPVADFSPVLQQAASDVGRFKLEAVTPAGGGLPESYLIDTATGVQIPIGRNQALQATYTALEVAAEAKYGDIDFNTVSVEELQELVDDFNVTDDIKNAVKAQLIKREQRGSQSATAAPPPT